MKKDFITLIKDIPNIERKFRKSTASNGHCVFPGEFIFDVPEFIE